ECSRLATLTGPVPDGDHLVPLGVADVKRTGTDVTIVALAYYVQESLAVADELAREGVSIEVLDPRTLVPMDVETLRASVQKTGRVVIVDEAPATCSAAAEIAALMVEDPDTFRALKAPVRRVCAMPVPVSYSPPLKTAAALDVKYAQSGPTGPLHCVPIIVKDNYDTVDMPTSAGSLSLKGSIPPRDAFQVRKLREAGAIMLVKTNMAEFAFDPFETVGSLLPGYTRNPYALERVTAGSSGGTAAAVAANFGTVG